MVDSAVMSNGHYGFFAGPDSSITESHWDSGPTFAELSTLVNYSAAMKIDGMDFGLEASEQVEDRSLADQAGAQSRGAMQASGNVELYTPGKDDTTSIYAQAWGTFATPRTRLAVMQRFVDPQGKALEAGDEVNVFRTITDAGTHNRNDASRTLGTTLVLQDDLHVNYIVPSAVPTAPAVTPSTAQALAIDDVVFLEVAYEGRNITAGATYTSSDENVAVVTNHGIILAVGDGTAEITVSYPGAAAATPIDITVGV